jgi:hypothetical protein
MKPMAPKQKPSKKETVKHLIKHVENLSMAVRVLQMTVRQAVQNFEKMDQDIGNTMGLLSDIQYRTRAMLEVGGFDKAAVDKAADKMKIEEFDKASIKDDEEKGYKVADDKQVAETDVVIMTSTTKTEDDKGIFRSKISMAQLQDPVIKEKLLGTKVGDKVLAKINGIEHEIEILGIREVPPPPAPPQNTDAQPPAASSKE